MRSIFAGLAVTVALSLGACGAKPAAGGEGKECKDLFEKFDGWCKDAKDPLKTFCDGQKTAIEALKKTPVEASCSAVTSAYKQIKDVAGAVPAGTPTTPPEAGSVPVGEPTPSSAPVGEPAPTK